MKSRRILYLSQEIAPYLDESDISLTARHLAQEIQEQGNEIRVFMPRFGVINERRNQLHEVIRLSGMNMIINNNDHPLIIKVASLPAAKLQIYFIDNDDFFKRKNLYGPDAKGVNDNDERSIFFVRGALETIKKLKWIPDVIHCHGTFVALGMLYLKKYYHDDPCLKKAKLVFSLYNEAEPVELTERLFDTLKFDKFKPAALAALGGKCDYEALSRLAIHYAHGVVQGSETIKPELLAYIQESGVPFLPFQGVKGGGAAYEEFYQKL